MLFAFCVFSIFTTSAVQLLHRAAPAPRAARTPLPPAFCVPGGGVGAFYFSTFFVLALVRVVGAAAATVDYETPLGVARVMLNHVNAPLQGPPPRLRQVREEARFVPIKVLTAAERQHHLVRPIGLPGCSMTTDSVIGVGLAGAESLLRTPLPRRRRLPAIIRRGHIAHRLLGLGAASITILCSLTS